MLIHQKTGIRIFIQSVAIFMATFFLLLAVSDGFEKVEESVYVGEFVSELEYDFVDFPTSIIRTQSSSQLSKVQRLVIIKVFDYLVPRIESKSEIIKVSFLTFTGIIEYFFHVLRISIASNAP
ncbi:hypothetical protein MM213_14465 [Belliella sp. R4-6]|uniref:Uncharacterized protein n=1 Tax=Belliella alkalica TaxID=1730871 RepID=A0ABS9VFH2_9BACT|nr:hypothetical protein [Belliella alkalica]MCH7414700.1 hypothetical protein [Belliella alkalica]